MDAVILSGEPREKSRLESKDPEDVSCAML